MALAVLLKQRRPAVKNVYGVIVQPNAPGDRFSIVCYDEQHLKALESVVAGSAWRAVQPKQPVVPGAKQCKYCSHYDNCDATKIASLIIPNTEGQVDITEDLITRVKDAKLMLKKLEYHVMDRAKRMLEKDPDSIPGYGLRNGKRTSKVVDAQQACQIMMEHNVSPQLFAKCCTVKITDLRKEFKQANDVSLKEATRQVADLLDDVIEVKESEPTIVKKQ